MNENDTAILERRKMESDARLDPSWHPERERPVIGNGVTRMDVSPRIRGARFGGLAAMHRLAIVSGLRDAIDERVHVLRRHLPYHESDHVLTMAYNVLCGGRCLEDVEYLRQDTAMLDLLGAHRIPDPTTLGDFLRRFGEWEILELMGAINKARLRVWRRQRKVSKDLALLDVDGTIAETFGECKEGMDIAYNGKWGYHPLLVTLANSQEVLFVANRPASRPSHDQAADYIDLGVDLVRRGGFRRVRVRGDSDFALTAHFDRWDADGVEFVFAIDAHPTFVERAQDLPERAWKALERPAKPTPKTSPRERPTNVKAQVIRARGFKNLELQGERIAEVEYRPARARGRYRMVIVEKNITVERGEEALMDEIRYFFYVTNIDATELSAAEIVFEANARCQQENVIEQMKNGVHAMRMPSDSLLSNWAYTVIAALPWNLKAWAGLVHPVPIIGRHILRMEFRRFARTLIAIACQVIRSARSIRLRIIESSQGVASLLQLHHYVRKRRAL